MTRREIRENLYAMLFQINFHDEDELQEQIGMYIEDIEKASEKNKAELKKKFADICDNIEEIDSVIESKAKGWTIDRIAKAELTVLRLAIFEIIYDTEVPNKVAINEAVELAKKYCADKASGFVNGILASFFKELPKEDTNGTD